MVKGVASGQSNSTGLCCRQMREVLQTLGRGDTEQIRTQCRYTVYSDVLTVLTRVNAMDAGSPL